jgi:hypothetical protein
VTYPDADFAQGAHICRGLRPNADPRFARRILDALNVTVIFRGDQAAQSVDPVIVAAQGYEQFSETFHTFKPAQLKAMLKDYGLATAQDLKGKMKVPQLVDLMWRGAQAKLSDISPRSRRWR